MLLMALSSCHMLWFLHLCSINKIVVEEYCDEAEAEMVEHADGSGEFSQATLRPSVVISSGDESLIDELHRKANELCFIARSVNFPVRHKARLTIV